MDTMDGMDEMDGMDRMDETLHRRANTAASGDPAAAAASGVPGTAAALGDPAAAAASGDPAAAAASGDPANTAASGDPANTAASGDPANTAASGVPGTAAASGDPAAAAASRARAPKHHRRRFDKKGEPIPTWRENLEAYAYLAPAGIILFVFWALPVLLSLVISFRNWKALDSMATTHWVGLSQYLRAFHDEDFRQSFWNTVNYVLYSVPPTLALALGAAMLLNTKIKGRAFFRTAFFLPYVTTWVAISIVWKYFFHREFGLANWFLMFLSDTVLGLETTWRLNWLAEPRGIWEMTFGGLMEAVGILGEGGGATFTLPHPLLAGPSLAMFSIVITSIWRDIGYFMIIFLAGLQNIDKSYYEAAEIDGAGPWQRFRAITFPLLSPITFFLMIISMIGAFKVFVPMLVMTGSGGPDNTTSTLVFYLYEKGFRSWLFGYASAIAYILFMIILAMTLLQNQLFGRKVEYGN